MKVTKFALPCFVARQQLGSGGSERLCQALGRGLPEGLPLFLRGLRGAAPAPSLFYRRSHGLREVLSSADCSRFRDRHLPCGGGGGAGFPSGPSAQGGPVARGVMVVSRRVPLCGLRCLARPRHLVTTSGHLRSARRVRFHPIPG